MLQKLNGMLANNNIDVGSLMDQLNKVAKSITCSGECARNQLRQKLRQEWDATKRNVIQAPLQERNAEKNYYVLDGKYQEYMAMLFQRNSTTADIFKKESLALHATFVDDLDVLTTQYTTEVRLAGRIEELFMTKMEEYVQLKQKLDTSEKNANTLGRKVAYEDNDGHRILVIKKMILFVYYGSFVMYLIFGTYFGKQQYRNKTMWWILYCYLFAPLVAYDLSKYVFDFVRWINYILQNTAPKNAFIDL